MRRTFLFHGFICIAVYISCQSESRLVDLDQELNQRVFSGGDATIFDASGSAFENPIPTLSTVELDKHFAGDAAFEQVYVTAPAEVNPGLGPVFNGTSCVGCHGRNGRGRSGFGDSSPFVGSLLMRVSLPGTDPNIPGAPLPVPGFGSQIGDRSVFGKVPEARIEVSIQTINGQFSDGEVYFLQSPTYRFVETYQELPPDILMSPRMAPPVFGRGLLEAINEADILALADPSDIDEDGISGRPNYVYDVKAMSSALGRFGRKANNPTILQQTAEAFHQDMGITNPLFPIESAFGQIQNEGGFNEVEVSGKVVEATSFYVQSLAVPARRDVGNPEVLRGEKLFQQANCSGCHEMSFTTGYHPISSLSNQLIYPFTDLLLHDMGEDLADNRPDFGADGREWKTPPLWGIGLTRTVNGIPAYLHDGRASTLLEAVMFHGGEAEKSREFVRHMPRKDRDALIAFLQSL